MGFMHVDNVSRNDSILRFKTLYESEKIHGTSSHIRWHEGKLSFFSGGAKHDSFVALFDQEFLTAKLTEKFGIENNPIIIYGEAYGGKLRFCLI